MVVNVYVFAVGTHGQGHVPVSAHSTLAGAKSVLRRQTTAVVEPLSDGVWMASEDGRGFWIYRLPVDGRR